MLKFRTNSHAGYMPMGNMVTARKSWLFVSILLLPTLKLPATWENAVLCTPPLKCNYTLSHTLDFAQTPFPLDTISSPIL